MLLLPNRFHCTPRSRPAVRETSTKRTSSITCCGDITETALMIAGAELARDRHRLVERDGIGHLPDSMMRPLTDDAADARAGKRRLSSLVQPR